MPGRIIVFNFVMMLSTCRGGLLGNFAEKSTRKDILATTSEQALDAQMRADHLHSLQKQIKGLLPRLQAGGRQARSADVSSTAASIDDQLLVPRDALIRLISLSTE